MTPYDALRRHCGLSHLDAARFHRLTNPKTVEKWCKGASEAPAGVVEELRALNDLIERMADQVLAFLDAAPHGAIDIGYPTDDHEAQTLGLPVVGAWRAMIGRVLAVTDRDITLVPRGSTPNTAAAAEIVGR